MRANQKGNGPYKYSPLTGDLAVTSNEQSQVILSLTETHQCGNKTHFQKQTKGSTSVKYRLRVAVWIQYFNLEMFLLCSTCHLFPQIKIQILNINICVLDLLSPYTATVFLFLRQLCIHWPHTTMRYTHFLCGAHLFANRTHGKVVGVFSFF